MPYRIVLVAALVISACAKRDPVPVSVVTPRPVRRPPVEKTQATTEQLKMLLEEIELKKTDAGVALRKIMKRYLPAKQAAGIAEKAAVTVLKVAGDSLLGAFVEVRPTPHKRCTERGEDTTRVYWLAVRVDGSGRKVLAATVVKTEMFRGRKPAPRVAFPLEAPPVPVFTVKLGLPDAKLCPQARSQWQSLKVLEVFSVVGGRINRILKINSEEQPNVSGTTVDNGAEVRWVKDTFKRLYLVVIAKTKSSTPLSSVPGPGDSGGERHYCTRKVTVQQITAAGVARTLSAATLEKRKMSTPGLADLPQDLTSAVQDACDGF